MLLSEFSPVDSDGDGVVVSYDCDDNDSGLGDIRDDEDCDGVLAVDDCDDADDANSWTVSTDGDCDGVLAVDDCDDADASYMGFYRNRW